MVIFITAAEALPPVVFPDEIKVNLIPGGDTAQENLDDFVDDPDNIDSELTWAFPSFIRTVLGSRRESRAFGGFAVRIRWLRGGRSELSRTRGINPTI